VRKLAIICLLTATLLGPGGMVVVHAQQMTPAEKRELFREGAKLWPVYCAQCHNARPGSEFAPYQWNQIIMHMRGLSNMPAKDAQAILVYLKGGRE
jgi:mono/diheme cytochrome c family protein